MTDPPRTQRWSLRLLASAVSLGLSLGAAEFALEALFPIRVLAADASADAYFGALGYAPQDTEASLAFPVHGSDPVRPKEPGVFRMVIVGESSSLGVPYPKDLSFGAFWEAGMAAVAPGRRFERVHLGENGRSSIGVVHFLPQALAAEPDALVVYSGHNEFIHRLTVASPFGQKRRFPWSALPRLDDAMQQFLDRASHRRSAEALAAVPEGLRREVQLPLDTLERGDHERRPFANFPITDRERALHRERYQRNLEEIAARARERGVPVLFVRPTSHLRCAPLASGLRFDPRATQRLAAAEVAARGGAASALPEFAAARDLDPAPVRMPTAHREAFDAVMERLRLPWIDGDACARAASGEAIPGDGAFVDFMHPRETVHRAIAEELAVSLGSLGLPGLAKDDALARETFRRATEERRAALPEGIAKGEMEGAQWFVMMYLNFGNRAAAEARAKAWPAEKRSLRMTLMLDLALRWGDVGAEADRELEGAAARHPEWTEALAAWRGAIRGIR